MSKPFRTDSLPVLKHLNESELISSF